VLLPLPRLILGDAPNTPVGKRPGSSLPIRLPLREVPYDPSAWRSRMERKSSIKGTAYETQNCAAGRSGKRFPERPIYVGGSDVNAPAHARISRALPGQQAVGAACGQRPVERDEGPLSGARKGQQPGIGP
jgi:hypothetical protein